MLATNFESRGELWRRTKSVMLNVLVCIPPKVVVWRWVWCSVFAAVSVCFLVTNVLITREIEFRVVHPIASLDFKLHRGWNSLRASRGAVIGNVFSKAKYASVDELRLSFVEIFHKEPRLAMPPKATDFDFYEVSIGDEVQEVYFTKMFSGSFTECTWLNKFVLAPSVTRINFLRGFGTGDEPVDRFLMNLQHAKIGELALGRFSVSSEGIHTLANTSIAKLRIDCEKLSPNDVKTLLSSATVADIELVNVTIGEWVDEFAKYASKHAGAVILSDESPESEIYHKLDRQYPNITIDVLMP